MSTLKLLRTMLGLEPKLPEIRIDQIAAGVPIPKGPRVAGRDLLSDLCRFDALHSPTFRQWVEALGLSWRAHRKLWELAYILQGLDERGMLAKGRRGLVFAVGREPLPALMAERGCDILATDLADGDDRATHWAKDGQWASGLDSLNAHGLCDPELFRRKVAFRPVDMNAIPEDLTGFDFTWSTCSFEHCGSIDLGIRFLLNQMRCLKPGGLAIHTTEFNLSSNESTVLQGGTVIFRLRDIQRILSALRADGHHVEPLDLRLGDHPYDRWIDFPPFEPATGPSPSQLARLRAKVSGAEHSAGHDRPHMRLSLQGYASTSIGLIIRKAA